MKDRSQKTKQDTVDQCSLENSLFLLKTEVIQRPWRGWEEHDLARKTKLYKREMTGKPWAAGGTWQARNIKLHSAGWGTCYIPRQISPTWLTSFLLPVLAKRGNRFNVMKEIDSSFQQKKLILTLSWAGPPPNPVKTAGFSKIKQGSELYLLLQSTRSFALLQMKPRQKGKSEDYQQCAGGNKWEEDTETRCN